MADKPAKPEQDLKIEPRNELHFKGKFTVTSGQRSTGEDAQPVRNLESFKPACQAFVCNVCIVGVCLLCLCEAVERLIDPIAAACRSSLSLGDFIWPTAAIRYAHQRQFDIAGIPSYST